MVVSFVSGIVEYFTERFWTMCVDSSLKFSSVEYGSFGMGGRLVLGILGSCFRPNTVQVPPWGILKGEPLWA